MAYFQVRGARTTLAAAIALVLACAGPAAAQDVPVTSFDGTNITAHWFPLPGLAAGQTAPTVLMGPGWGSPGDTDVNGHGFPGAGLIGIADLHAAGYNVLTWDPRGFGTSGGTIETDSPHFEGRDVQALISWVSGQPGVQLDAPGDPRMGMAGPSYGGGIQLITAAIDPRVDAIVPDLAWHSLVTSLGKGGIAKIGWGTFLTNLAKGHRVDPVITQSYQRTLATGVVTPTEQQWYADRGPGSLVSKIRAPTLLVSGTVDTLFTLQEAVDNYRALAAGGTPVHMLWFCGGHGVCLTPQGDPNRAGRATIAWLNRYVKRDTSVDTGPVFSSVDQNGTQLTASSYPPPLGRPLTARGHGTLRMKPGGGAGPVVVPPSAGGLGSIPAAWTPARARNAVNVVVRSKRKATVLSAPALRLRYRGKLPRGKRPEIVFAQLVDGATGRVLGNQITPIPLRLDGRTHTKSTQLEIVDQTVPARGRLILQLVATTPAYATPRLGGRVRFTDVRVSLPTAR